MALEDGLLHTVTKMKLSELAYEVDVPEGITVNISPDMTITAKGKNGEAVRSFRSIGISVSKEDNKIKFAAKNVTKKEKRLLGTFKSHMKNMLEGVLNGHQYKLKICSSHFPMTVSLKGTEFSIKNFLGEKVPRTTQLLKGVNVNIEGDVITVDSPDLEKAGIVASRIELITFISKKDRRVFQDGIYIFQKPGVHA